MSMKSFRSAGFSGETMRSLAARTSGAKAPPQRLPARRQEELARPAIIGAGRAHDDALRFEPVDDDADIVPVDAHGLGQRLLMDAGNVVDEHQHGIFELHQAGIRQRLRDHRHADLLQPANERRRDAAEGDAARPITGVAVSSGTFAAAGIAGSG